MLHSGLGQGERYDEWLRLRSGEARVCVGPRSAVFAPLADIGLIVVDEEHDASYKHEGDPRYDARTVAIRRAEQHGAVLLAGSATPRPESAVALTRLRLRDRIDGRALPPVEVLDMRGVHHPLHPDDADGAGRRAERGRQGDRPAQPARLVELPLLPRLRARVDVPELRGRARAPSRRRPASPAITAATAGAAPSRCEECGSVAVARHGAGTESVEEELREAFGDRSFRCSGSTPTSPPARAVWPARSRRSRPRPPGVLVGTQMVAKGHDFADVALGVVLDADQTLRFPDFRAEERTFALVTQLAGRVGRGWTGGPAAGARPDARAVDAQLARVRRPPRLRRLPRARSSAGAACSATRRSGR